MKTPDSVLSSEAQRSEQASERTGAQETYDKVKRRAEREHYQGDPAPAKFSGRAADVEIEHLRKLARDMRNGLTHLSTVKAEPYDIIKRRANLSARLTTVEGKIFRLQQGRLL